jgi:hypothetical protein
MLVDMEVVKRIRRYSTALNGAGIVGGTRSFYLFKNALREFEIIKKVIKDVIERVKISKRYGCYNVITLSK